ncbi:tyrosine-protein phosphatase non-receptor type substrate 1-like [Discoglossus pictus]
MSTVTVRRKVAEEATHDGHLKMPEYKAASATPHKWNLPSCVGDSEPNSGIFSRRGESALRVLQDPPILVLPEGRTAKLSCTAEDAPTSGTLLFYWSSNGSIMSNSSRITVSSSLLITSVTPVDSGQYVCSVRSFHRTQTEDNGNGTELLVTVTPTLSVRMEAVEPGRWLLVCEAKRFYPQELNISWSFSLRGLQIQENLTEDEDGTYSKTSSVEITEELMDLGGSGVTCYLQHITLTEPLSKTWDLPKTSPYTLPYTLLGLVLLVVVGFLFSAYRCSQVRKRLGTSEPGAGEKRLVEPAPQERDGGTELHYATIFPRLSGEEVEMKQPKRKPLRKEENIEYAHVRLKVPATQDNTEEAGVCYATLTM